MPMVEPNVYTCLMLKLSFEVSRIYMYMWLSASENWVRKMGTHAHVYVLPVGSLQ